MATTVTSTKEVGAAGFTLNDFTSKISGTIAKVGATDVSEVVLTDGVVEGADRLVDMTSDSGRLERLVVQRVRATGLRRGITRVRDAGNVLIEDVYATGANPPGDYYPTGVATSDIMAGTLTIRRAVFTGFWGKEASYTNGDGVATEELVTSLLEDVVCEDNADGGVDLKGKTTVRRARASRNHRNFRFWGQVEASDLTSENPRNAHIWVGGGARFKGGTIVRPTFVGGSNKPHLKIDSDTPAVTLVIEDPVVPAGETLRVDKEGGSQVKVVVRYTKDGGIKATLPTPPRFGAEPPVEPPVEPEVPSSELDSLRSALSVALVDRDRALARLRQVAELAARPL